MKKASSAWVREEAGLPSFHWQVGYAGFTVSPPARKRVSDYIARQEEHHRRKSFLEELKDILKMAGVEFDPAYLE